METKKTGKNTWFRVVVVILMAIIIALLCYQKFFRKAEPTNALEASLKARLGQLVGDSGGAEPRDRGGHVPYLDQHDAGFRGR
jgi:uncharacterized membrane protein YqiK